ncbi:hypothetical protein Cgig2_027940 [Carnegiea gigantea]|uniref:BED-type domain-containing protein n=1 Tax=Carnegiea gigantea TaxID=171969 RepID=A0A9Q1JFK4_9CARY|nr:hypothetical protein Cgig2_027940 [Carnegiea gigantea]
MESGAQSKTIGSPASPNPASGPSPSPPPHFAQRPPHPQSRSPTFVKVEPNEVGEIDPFATAGNKDLLISHAQHTGTPPASRRFDAKSSTATPALTPNATAVLGPLVEDDKKKRSSMRLEFLPIDGINFSDGKKQAKCLHSKKETFIANAQYGTTNMKKHLEKCKAYQAANSSEEGGGEKRFEEKVYRDLQTRAIIRHGIHKKKKKKNSSDQMWINQTLDWVSLMDLMRDAR